RTSQSNCGLNFPACVLHDSAGARTRRRCGRWIRPRVHGMIQCGPEDLLPIFPRLPYVARRRSLVTGMCGFGSGPSDSCIGFRTLNRSALLIAGMGAILLSPEMGARAQSPAPASVTAENRAQSQTTLRPGGLPREVIILNNGSDIGEFWKRLNQPDLILIKPGTPSSPPAPAIPAAT